MRQAFRHGNFGIAAGVLVLTVNVLLFVFANTSEAVYQAGGLLRCSSALQLA